MNSSVLSLVLQRPAGVASRSSLRIAQQLVGPPRPTSCSVGETPLPPILRNLMLYATLCLFFPRPSGERMKVRGI